MPKPKAKAVKEDSDIEDEAIKEEKMDFQYDDYRKKYTVKAEEVEEDIEDDFIEDNYEDF